MITDPVQTEKQKRSTYELCKVTISNCYHDKSSESTERDGLIADITSNYQGFRIVMNVTDMKKLMEKDCELSIHQTEG